MPADLYVHRPLADHSDGCRNIIAPSKSGWDQIAMGEWSLTAAGFGDCHPHDEVTYVLDGLLEVDCDGVRVSAGPGDVVHVPAGHPAYYYAPQHARMLFIYGPNPDGLPATTFEDRSQVAPPSP